LLDARISDISPIEAEWLSDAFILSQISFDMATGIGRGKICLTSFNSLTPKTPFAGRNDFEDISIQTELLHISSQISLP